MNACGKHLRSGPTNRDVIRCIGHYAATGKRCGLEALPGSVACATDGGSASPVQRRAVQRVICTADVAAQNLVTWVNDGVLPWGERVKIARALMDRAGLSGVQKVAAVENPVEALFKTLLNDPDGL